MMDQNGLKATFCPLLHRREVSKAPIVTFHRPPPLHPWRHHAPTVRPHVSRKLAFHPRILMPIQLLQLQLRWTWKKTWKSWRNCRNPWKWRLHHQWISIIIWSIKNPGSIWCPFWMMSIWICLSMKCEKISRINALCSTFIQVSGRCRFFGT